MNCIKGHAWKGSTTALLVVSLVHASPPVSRPAATGPVSIQQLESELARKPDDPAVRDALAGALYKDHQFNRALDVYAPLYKARSTELPIVRKYAILMVASGKAKDDVESIYGNLLKLGPMASRAEAWAGVAEVYISDLHWDSADRAFREALAADEKNVTVIRKLGDYRILQGQLDDAARIFEQLLPMSNNAPADQRRLINAYLLGNHADKAATLIASMLARNPKDAATLELQGHAFLQLKKLEDAVVSLSRALEADPSANTALYYRAMAYGNLQQPDKAIADARSLVERSPSAFKSRLMLAKLYGENNQAVDAEKIFQDLISTNPESTAEGKNVRLEYDQFLVAHGSPPKFNLPPYLYVTYWHPTPWDSAP